MDLLAAITETKKRLSSNRLVRFTLCCLASLGLLLLAASLLLQFEFIKPARIVCIISMALSIVTFLYGRKLLVADDLEAATKLDAILDTRNRAASYVETKPASPGSGETAKAEFLAFQLEPLLKDFDPVKKNPP